MPSDIVFPDKNDKAFVELAERLGYSRLFLVCKYSKTFADLKKRISALKKSSHIDLRLGFLAEPGQIHQAKKTVPFVVTRSSENDREVIEKRRPSLIFELENKARKDQLHYRSSGLNQVLCTLLHKNRVVVGLSFNMLLKPRLNRQQLLGRVIQNVRLCTKYNVKMVLASFAKDPYEMRSPHDLVAFAKNVGMNTEQAKESVEL